MKTHLLIATFLAVLPFAPAGAADVRSAVVKAALPRDAIPAQLDETQRAGYRSVFAALRDQKWLDARLQLATMPTGPLHMVALAELMTAKGSPKASVEDLTKLLAEAPDLPQAEQIARLAKTRGVTELPTLPFTRALSWTRGAPVRSRAKSSRSDLVAADL
ncbi:MAG: lytic transglycosylase domain-containing protein, partial [Sphingomonas sp.]|nr:lytic transglycosylase domain-containing protein [Sphingomonas sp.]